MSSVTLDPTYNEFSTPDPAYNEFGTLDPAYNEFGTPDTAYNDFGSNEQISITSFYLLTTGPSTPLSFCAQMYFNLHAIFICDFRCKCQDALNKQIFLSFFSFFFEIRVSYHSS